MSGRKKEQKKIVEKIVSSCIFMSKIIVMLNPFSVNSDPISFYNELSLTIQHRIDMMTETAFILFYAKCKLATVDSFAKCQRSLNCTRIEQSFYQLHFVELHQVAVVRYFLQ